MVCSGMVCHGVLMCCVLVWSSGFVRLGVVLSSEVIHCFVVWFRVNWCVVM